MSKLLRYQDLVARGIVANRATLSRRISAYGFPPGFLLGPNSRAWSEAEVEAWVAQRAELHADKVKPRGARREKIGAQGSQR